MKSSWQCSLFVSFDTYITHSHLAKVKQMHMDKAEAASYECFRHSQLKCMSGLAAVLPAQDALCASLPSDCGA